jgi:hypothetical protein
MLSFFQYISEGDRIKILVSFVLGGMSLVLLVISFQLNFHQERQIVELPHAAAGQVADQTP